jgi:hypothetical protein
MPGNLHQMALAGGETAVLTTLGGKLSLRLLKFSNRSAKRKFLTLALFNFQHLGRKGRKLFLIVLKLLLL